MNNEKRLISSELIKIAKGILPNINNENVASIKTADSGDAEAYFNVRSFFESKDGKPLTVEQTKKAEEILNYVINRKIYDLNLLIKKELKRFSTHAQIVGMNLK